MKGNQMDNRPVESTQFSCSRLGKDTQIDIYSRLKPFITGTALPARLVREMRCQNDNNCGIAAKGAGSDPTYAWHLCPANDIFLEKGTLIQGRR
jgi:hypothetical protein